jgi:hypothetical protein
MIALNKLKNHFQNRKSLYNKINNKNIEYHIENILIALLVNIRIEPFTANPSLGFG